MLNLTPELAKRIVNTTTNPDQCMESDSANIVGAKPSISKHTSLRKRRVDLVDIRNRSRDSVIESRRKGEQTQQHSRGEYVSEVVDEEDDEEKRLNDAEALRIWCAYIEGLGLPYSGQYNTLKAAFDMFDSESFTRATDAVLQVLQVDQLNRLVEVMIEVSTSTWEQREEYISMTLQILFNLTAPTERDAIPLLIQTRLLWYITDALDPLRSEPPIEHLVTIFGDIVGNMCTQADAYQRIIDSDLMNNMCCYLVRVNSNDSLLFALRGMVEPITELTPRNLEPLAGNLIPIFNGLANRPMPEQFGQTYALEMLGFIVRFNPMFVRYIFTGELIAAVIHSLRGHNSVVHREAILLFARISEDGDGLDMILAGSEMFLNYVENRMLCTTQMPEERRLLFVILCNLMTATGRFSLVIKNYNIREVLVSSMDSGSGLVRVEATFTWEYAIRFAEQFESLKRCVWPVKGFDAVRFFTEALQFQDSHLREDTVLTLIHIIRVCRRCAEPGWKSMLRLLFRNTSIQEAVLNYFHAQRSPSQSRAHELLDMIDTMLNADDDMVEGGDEEEPLEIETREGEIDYEYATHSDWAWVAPTEEQKQERREIDEF